MVGPLERLTQQGYRVVAVGPENRNASRFRLQLTAFSSLDRLTGAKFSRVRSKSRLRNTGLTGCCANCAKQTKPGEKMPMKLDALPDYLVQFDGGNVKPVRDRWNWGHMKEGVSSANFIAESYWWDGLNLSLYRPAPPPPLVPVSKTVYVVLGNRPLRLQSRILLRLEFERPWAQAAYVQQPWDPSNVPAAAPAPPPQKPEPWAIGLNIKVGDENDVDTEARVGATCQFNSKGVRLNVPGAEEKPYFNTLPEIETPLNYESFNPFGQPAVPFFLELDFTGISQSTAPHLSQGTARLEVGSKTDTRIFTHGGLYPGGAPSHITALGAALVTATGVGQIMARLSSFSVWVKP